MTCCSSGLTQEVKLHSKMCPTNPTCEPYQDPCGVIGISKKSYEELGGALDNCQGLPIVQCPQIADAFCGGVQGNHIADLKKVLAQHEDGIEVSPLELQLAQQLVPMIGTRTAALPRQNKTMYTNIAPEIVPWDQVPSQETVEAA